MPSPILAAGVVALLLEAAVKCTLVIALAWLTVRGLRRGTAAARHWLWTVAAAAVVALPALSVLLPAWPMPLFPETTVWSYAVAKVGPVDATSLAPRRASSAERADPVPAGPWRMALLSLWAVGALGTGAWFAAGSLRSRRLTRHALPFERGRHAGPIEVLLCEGAATAMTAGIRRPVILLPADAEEWTDERLRIVLLHELAHVRRRDCMAQLATDLACILYWFHPAVWYAARRLRIERERACDDVVLRAGVRPSDYAGHLLALASGGPCTALAFARRANLEERLEAILDPEVSHRASSRAALAAAPLLVVALLLPLAALDPWAAEPTSPISTSIR